MKRWYKLAALVAGVATLAGAGASARVADAAPSAQAPIQVGVVYSRTGRLAAYGAQFVQGLRYGIAYATKGTGRGQRPQDRAHARRRRHRPGQGGRRGEGPDRQGLQDHHRHGVVGHRARSSRRSPTRTRSSTSPGPAATDAVTGINKYTFRVGPPDATRTCSPRARTSAAAAGKNVTVFAQDSAFGHRQLRRRERR